MPTDHLEIAPVPADESCQAVGMPDYNPVRARAECKAFIGQLRRTFGPEPDGARLRIKSNPHDFGTYLDVVCDYTLASYDPDDDTASASADYAYRLESGLPLKWDDTARQELGLA